MLKAHFNPAAIQRKEGSESIIISMFKPKQKQQNSQQDNSNSDNSSNNDEWNDNEAQSFSGNFNDFPFPILLITEFLKFILKIFKSCDIFREVQHLAIGA